jgi:hypothetical protein
VLTGAGSGPLSDRGRFGSWAVTMLATKIAQHPAERIQSERIPEMIR